MIQIWQQKNIVFFFYCLTNLTLYNKTAIQTDSLINATVDKLIIKYMHI